MSPFVAVLGVLAAVALPWTVVMAMRLIDSETQREVARMRIEQLETKNRRLFERLEEQVAARYAVEGELVQERRQHVRVLGMLLDELGEPDTDTTITLRGDVITAATNGRKHR